MNGKKIKPTNKEFLLMDKNEKAAGTPIRREITVVMLATKILLKID
jgi:hypothetical protein